MNVINIMVVGIFVLVVFYKNWIPSVIEWMDDRMHGTNTGTAPS
jgi:hypothetical protein